MQRFADSLKKYVKINKTSELTIWKSLHVGNCILDLILKSKKLLLILLKAMDS